MHLLRDMPWREYKAYHDFLVRCPWFMNPYFSRKKEGEDEPGTPGAEPPKFFEKPEDFPEPEPMSAEDLASSPFVKGAL